MDYIKAITIWFLIKSAWVFGFICALLWVIIYIPVIFITSTIERIFDSLSLLIENLFDSIIDIFADKCDDRLSSFYFYPPAGFTFKKAVRTWKKRIRDMSLKERTDIDDVYDELLGFLPKKVLKDTDSNYYKHRSILQMKWLRCIEAAKRKKDHESNRT